MEDYTVGSLADLITGSNTPNKPRVTEKAFKKRTNDNVTSSPIQKKKLKAKSKIKKPVENSDMRSIFESIVKEEKNKALKNKKIKDENDNENSKVQVNVGEDITSMNLVKETKRLKKKKQKKQKLKTSDYEDNLIEKIESEDHSKTVEVKSEEDQQIVQTLTSDNEGKRLKKKKRKKSKVDTSESNPNSSVASEELPTMEEQLIVNEKNDERRAKVKKRKLDTSKSDEDGDETPIKKEKLSINDKNAERRIKQKLKEEKKVRDPSDLARTIFIGNVPINATKSKIKQHFKQYGDIETIRFRGIPVSDVKISKKVAAITKDFNSKRNSFHCYVKFKRKEDAVKAEVENGTIFEDHHLRVHCCQSNEKPDETKAIFVGNLSFEAEEDELWKLFETCGPISYIRIVRDAFTGMGKGFAYINFKESDAVQLALEMENITYKNRQLRISHCSVNAAKKKKKHNKRNNQFNRSGKQTEKGQNQNKRFQKTDGTAKEKNDNPTSPKLKKEINGDFQGKKFAEKKKKRKINKGLLEKKKIVKKMAPKAK